MTTMLVPAVNSYFAIYTLEGAREHQKKRGLSWDLHATATDKSMAISHARMLALQPGVSEVHVKQVIEDTISGLVSVRNIKRCRRGGFLGGFSWFSARTGACAALASACVIASFLFMI
jgi:hypothetical protein